MSQEGTTQGDPLAMPMYAVATLPLIRKLPRSVRQTWYADDATALGAITNLRTWWDDLVTSGPGYGYFPNASKTWLVTKTDFHSEATVIFGDTNVDITSVGRPHLGAPLGTKVFAEQFVLDKVTDWSNQVKLLSVIATTQPYAAFAAFIHGISSRWTFLARTVPNIGYLFKQLEDTIRTAFIPTITGQPPPNDTNRGLFGLPPRLGGLGLLNPVLQSDSEFSASLMVTKPLKELILRQEFEYPYEALADQITAKADVRQLRSHQASQAASTIKETLSPPLLRALDLAQEKGASNWLTSLPIEEYGFCLHKGAFTDALALRYGWVPSRTPVNCVCGTSFSVEHVLSCSRGGFPSIRHNEIRDLTADLLTNVCKDVRVEPDLMPVTNESLSHASANSTNGARLDIAANGLWGGRFERSYMDVRVFNPLAPSNKNSITACYKKHENEKKRAYEQRVREIEHASFTPLVFSATGGMGPQATILYKRLASLLADKWDQPYSTTMSWMRCRLSFSLLRSAILCIRGARSSIGHAIHSPPPIDLVVTESRVSVH